MVDRKMNTKGYRGYRVAVLLFFVINVHSVYPFVTYKEAIYERVQFFSLKYEGPHKALRIIEIDVKRMSLNH